MIRVQVGVIHMALKHKILYIFLGFVLAAGTAVLNGCGSSVSSNNQTPTQASAPTFSPAAGTYTTAQTVTISDATAGATIHYTSNGTTPTTASNVYSGAITVPATAPKGTSMLST